ncbi:peptidoglycan hydrolase-like protein with peptidoglycan-binding domain [Deinobacterium chartae]|uniref:Peptidoglycan hydrolase-like protein with peptidoglycan-binding domain n=1 Tax=Deinobacterium chartae TaxID=521158 RepID=A0A841HV47_9DEIO|nr:peptidoglycan-binding protein [Deinobacterium chartae]MBB6097247.1 peptidoglycan hydrolase-like protein with peptidoglycan-binding domain [Deinobacterium chartae]
MRNFLAVSVLALTLSACSQNNPVAPATTETPATAMITPQALPSWPVLRNGSTGSAVTAAQYLLRARGYSISADGVFGSGTESAVRSFQSAQGLTADGIIGANTWTRLIVTVQSGSTGDAVRAAQTLLRAKGYSVTVDGVFGSGTVSAVRSFQSAQGLSADGIVGPNTWQALAGSGSSTPDSRASLAQQILNDSGISLLTYHVSGNGAGDGADAASNIRDTAAGRAAKRSSYGTAPGGSVYLDTNMLSGIVRLGQTYSFRITEIAGGSHSANSRHYAGVAFDVDLINGQRVGSGAPHAAFMSACRSLGATEVLGPGDSGHSTHVHCAWPR